MDDENPVFSRSGRTDAGGKLTARLDVPVSQETEEAVIALAAMSGVSKAEYVRMLIERAVFGEFTLVRRLAARAQGTPWDERRTMDRVGAGS